MIKAKCKCDWNLYSDRPRFVRCGRCRAQVFVGDCGWGDNLEALINRLGGVFIKLAYKRLFGVACGCEARQAWLNEAGRKLRAWVLPRR